jgi:hypothetical protein
VHLIDRFERVALRHCQSMISTIGKPTSMARFPRVSLSRLFGDEPGCCALESSFMVTKEASHLKASRSGFL